MKFLLTVSFLAITLCYATRSRAADPVPVMAVAPDITGKWSGSWVSCTNGHKGPLHAKICKISDTCYEATFRGRFFVVLPFRYVAKMQVIGQEGDKLILSSSRNLGPLLGKFEMTAMVSSTEFTADYTSRDDRGRFTMTHD